jgi:hypothetical protein
MTPLAIPSEAFIILKLFVLLGIAVYIVFAAVMVRQENLMSHVLEEGFEPVLRIVTIVHLLLSILLFFLALIFL